MLVEPSLFAFFFRQVFQTQDCICCLQLTEFNSQVAHHLPRPSPASTSTDIQSSQSPAATPISTPKDCTPQEVAKSPAPSEQPHLYLPPLQAYRQYLCRNTGDVDAQFAESPRPTTLTPQQIWSPDTAQEPHARRYRAFGDGMVDLLLRIFNDMAGFSLSDREFPERNQVT
ncbi:hypothetical protein ALO98_200380 [Pseudomonas syringae pv. tagetis]|nr:hypothetical protein ALO98_200380 [Pseudomonas syringae pv. tagetis]